MSQKRVAIFTNFNSADPAYSLNRVVQDQIKMFTRNDYAVKVIVAEGFTPVEEYKNVELAYVPNVPCHNEVKKDDSFESDVETIYQALKSALSDVDVVLTHDIIYQPSALKHNFAARKWAAEKSQVKWLHWIHSATSPYTLATLQRIFEDKYIELVRKPFPNSFYVFFNDYSKPRVAANFGVQEHLVKTVHHPIDLAGFYGISPSVVEFVEEYGIMKAEAVCIYPCRLDRGKQVEMAIKTMAMLKTLDFTVKMIVVDFHSTGGDKVTYRDDLRNTAIDYGLNPQELIFTSSRPEWAAQTPHSVVRELMMFSNILIMPSVSESYSLVTQEAASLGHIIVLNGDFPPFRDIFGENAIYRKYSSGIDIMNGMDGWTNTVYGPDAASPQERKYHEKMYHKETAGMIAYRLRNYDNLALRTKIRTTRNLDTVFKRELEPLLYAEIKE